MGKRKHSQQVQEEIRQLRREGCTYAEIVRQTGVAQGTIWAICNRYGVPADRLHVPPENYELVLKAENPNKLPLAPYQPLGEDECRDIAVAIEALREAVAGGYDSVKDVVAYVRALRYGEEVGDA